MSFAAVRWPLSALRGGAVIAVALAAAVAAPMGDDDGAFELTDTERRLVLAASPLGAPPPDPTNSFADDLDAAALGHRLFFDDRLAGDGARSCASCHDPALHFTDGKPVAEGAGAGRRNTPTVVNSAYRRTFFWDGRADTLWSQALHPLETDVEMAGSRVQVAKLVLADPVLRAAYVQAFGDAPSVGQARAWPATARPVPGDHDHAHDRAWQEIGAGERAAIDRVFVNVGKALAAYQRRLVSDRAPFDLFVEGVREDDADKRAALDDSALRGLRLFFGRAGCRRCHSGPSFTDESFHNLGLPGPGGGMPRDPGRYGALEVLRADPFRAEGGFSDDPKGATARRTATAVAGPDQWGAFRTPSLRDVARTPPYMHAGQLATLEDVLAFYSTLENQVRLDHHEESVLVPLHLDERETADLLAFLRSLVGDGPPPRWIRPPE